MLIADTVNELAARLRLPADIFAEKWRDVEILKTRGGVDRYLPPVTNRNLIEELP